MNPTTISATPTHVSSGVLLRAAGWLCSSRAGSSKPDETTPPSTAEGDDAPADAASDELELEALPPDEEPDEPLADPPPATAPWTDPTDAGPSIWIETLDCWLPVEALEPPAEVFCPELVSPDWASAVPLSPSTKRTAASPITLIRISKNPLRIDVVPRVPQTSSEASERPSPQVR